MELTASSARVSLIFGKALDAHHANDPTLAQILYEEVVTNEPHHSEANHNLGTVFFDKNEYDKALKFFKIALNINPNVSQYWASYIDGLIQLDRIVEATALINAAKEAGLYCDRIALIDQRLQRKGKEPSEEVSQQLNDLLQQYKFSEVATECHRLEKVFSSSAILSSALGNAYVGLGEVELAISYFVSATQYNPEWPDFLTLGMLYEYQGDLDASLATFTTVMDLNPDLPEIGIKVALILFNREEYDQVINLYNKLLRNFPNMEVLHNNKGLALIQKGQEAEALKCFKRALKINPDYPDSLCNLGYLQQENDQSDEARSNYERAIKIDPEHQRSHVNLTIILNELGLAKSALESADMALYLEPICADTYNNLGIIYSDLSKPIVSIKKYKKALELDPTHTDAHFNMSLQMLKIQNFSDGWLNYENRFQSATCTSEELVTNKPRFSPEKKAGRVLLWPEQGLGDEIMFSSIINDMYKVSEKLIVQADDRLISLFRRSFPSDIRFYSSKFKIFESEYDTHLPIGSLPMNFRGNLTSFKKSSGTYLKPDIQLVSRLRAQLLGKNNTQVIGITWEGGTDKKNLNRRKAIDLEMLVRIFDGTNVQLVNLQYGDTDDELKDLAENYGVDVTTVKEIDNLGNIDGLAALISACDQVVSVDNTTVFLAAALGIKTSVLLPFSCDWRWGIGKTNSHWHSSIKLYQQAKLSDWSAPLKKLKTAINGEEILNQQSFY